MDRRLAWPVASTLLLFALLVAPAAARAQSLGTFRWQLQPFCNVVTVTVTQQGANYTLDGYDDQCGAPQRAPVVGVGTPNPDGTIGFGLNVITVPGGRGVQIDARISLPGLGGPWSDSAGNSGTFAYNASSGGNPRPLPTGGSTIPNTFVLQTDGGFLAGGATGAGAIPASGAGTRMMWHPAKAAFRAGQVSGSQWDDASVGPSSVAMGQHTRAIGDASTAFGHGTAASGVSSTALGHLTVANGGFATAMGSQTLASATVSTAMGFQTVASGTASTAMGSGSAAGGTASTAMGSGSTASGLASTAMGYQSVASGDYSRAMGYQATASGVSSTAIGVSTTAAALGSMAMGTYADASAAAAGSFVYGDRSTVGSATRITSFAPNQFLVRAAGGVGFYTNAALTSGLQLAVGGSQWLGVSDVNMKHEFRDLNGEDVLGKIAAMPVQEWSYKSQDSTIRHVGPTAQDFHAAFGLGEDPLRIGTLDADGIALAAVKALEARTRDGAVLRERVAALELVNEALLRRLARLEALLEKR